LISFSFFGGEPHAIGWWLIGNGVGLALVIGATFWWRDRKYNWPVPKKSTTGTAHSGSTHAKSRIARGLLALFVLGVIASVAAQAVPPNRQS